MTPVLSRRALNRATLARQLLLRRSELSVPQAVEHLVGLQAQTPHSWYVGLWTRLSGFRADQAADLLTDRRLVRMALMRSTIHLVTAPDARALRTLVQPVLDRDLFSNGTHGRPIRGIDVAALTAEGSALLAERPMTAKDVGQRLQARWPDVPPATLAYALRNLLPLVQVPPRGLWGRSGPIAHTTADAWLGPDAPRRLSVRDLVLRYLAAFGPATIADAQRWSGLTRLREVVDPMRPDLLTFRGENGEELFDLPDAPRPEPDASAPPRFLYDFDNVLLSHADRSRVITEDFARYSHRPHGPVPSVVLIDGFTGGDWTIVRAPDATTLRIRPYASMPEARTAELMAEGSRLLAFTDPAVESRTVEIDAELIRCTRRRSDPSSVACHTGPMPQTTDDPRQQRRVAETLDAFQLTEGHPNFRVDVERIRFSPYYSRLSAVTQVISQTGAGLAVHNRLTHSIKVAAIARAIASHLSTRADDAGRVVQELGGAHPVVVQAAAAAHDLGHPPFGHLGEQTLDRLARHRFGLAEGFEGNAQTFRIISRLDEHDRPGVGLNLTAAVRAAVLKYPWLRGQGGPSRGGASKFNFYAIDEPDAREALSAYPLIERGQQTVECSIMDISDDIAYSLHDLDDFYRAGLLNAATLSAEFRNWHRDLSRLRTLDDDALSAGSRTPGHSLELLWRRLQSKDAWIADADAFGEAVARVKTEVIEGLLAEPFDGSLSNERALAGFTTAWIARLQSSVEVHRHPDIRSGHVSLDRRAWHEVAVLKFLHQRFILERPDLTVYQRGQASVLERLVDGFAAWLDDPRDARRAPRRLIDLVELAAEDHRRLGGPETDADRRRLARGRGIIDYVASLTDAQAGSLDALLAGQTERLWEAGQGL